MQWTNEAVTLLHLVFLLCSIFCGVDFGELRIAWIASWQTNQVWAIGDRTRDRPKGLQKADESDKCDS